LGQNSKGRKYVPGGKTKRKGGGEKRTKQHKIRTTKKKGRGFKVTTRIVKTSKLTGSEEKKEKELSATKTGGKKKRSWTLMVGDVVRTTGRVVCVGIAKG